MTIWKITSISLLIVEKDEEYLKKKHQNRQVVVIYLYIGSIWFQTDKFYQKETNDYVERQYSANLTQLFMLIKKIYVYISDQRSEISPSLH